MTTEDHTEVQRPLQSVGSFLIGQDGLIRWAQVEPAFPALPNVDELLSRL